MTVALTLYLCIELFSGALGFPSYANRIPNGGNVMYDGLLWPGVGHIARAGGGSTNPFGAAFAQAGHEWTEALCKADSDGDGQSNGLELGDPDCIWTPGSTPTRNVDIRHPGFDDSIASATSQITTTSIVVTTTSNAITTTPSASFLDILVDKSNSLYVVAVAVLACGLVSAMIGCLWYITANKCFGYPEDDLEKGSRSPTPEESGPTPEQRGVTLEQSGPTPEEMGVTTEEFYTSQFSVTVLGASGDLAKKETFPALLDLYAHRLIPEHTAIVGFARSDQTSEEFREYLRPWLLNSYAGQMEINKKVCDQFLAKVVYFKGSYDSADDFGRLATVLKEEEGKGFQGKATPPKSHRVFYFAIPPFAFLSAADSIKKSALSSSGFNRIIVEKPFGSDLASAKDLANKMGKIFEENQIFRMDHFLGYDLNQNIQFIRFDNQFLEPLMSCQHVACVRISLKEDFGTQGRGGYFTHYGIIRDVIQNHLLQMLCLVAMDCPSTISKTADIRDAKVKLLKEMQPFDPKLVVYGQYEAGMNSKGQPEPGFLEDDSIADEDREKAQYCATFCQMVVRINNKRWKGVPFIIRAGKGLEESKCEVRVQFKPVDGHHRMANGAPRPRNELVMRVSPDEAVYLKCNVKNPGLSMQSAQSELDLSYKTRYRGVYNPSAYTRLILAGIRGHSESFVRSDELLASWGLFTPLLQTLEGAKKVMPVKYKFGSRGPEKADEMLAQIGYKHEEGYSWHEDP